MPAKVRPVRPELYDAEWAVVVKLAEIYPKNPRGQLQTSKSIACLVRLGMNHAIDCCKGDALELRAQEREILRANLVRRKLGEKFIERQGKRNR